MASSGVAKMWTTSKRSVTNTMKTPTIQDGAYRRALV